MYTSLFSFLPSFCFPLSVSLTLPLSLTPSSSLRLSGKVAMSSRCYRSTSRTHTQSHTTSTTLRSWRSSRLEDTEKRNGSNLSQSFTTECFCGTAHEQPTLLVFCLRLVGVYLWSCDNNYYYIKINANEHIDVVKSIRQRLVITKYWLTSFHSVLFTLG